MFRAEVPALQGISIIQLLLEDPTNKPQHVYVCIYIYIYIYTHMYNYVYMYVFICIYTYVSHYRTHQINRQLNTINKYNRSCRWRTKQTKRLHKNTMIVIVVVIKMIISISKNLCIYIYIYVYMYVYIYIYVCIYIYNVKSYYNKQNKQINKHAKTLTSTHDVVAGRAPSRHRGLTD